MPSLTSEQVSLPNTLTSSVQILSAKERQKETLDKDCSSLEQKLGRLQNDIEKVSLSEQGMCEKLKKEGARELEEAKKRWQQAEKEELKKRESQMSPKLKT